MAVNRHHLLRRAAPEYQWLGLSSSRWKSFLGHIELPDTAHLSWTFPSATLSARSSIRRTPESRDA
jgi:hypothetical protein